VAAGETAVNSPMPGNIFKVECKVGQAVQAGDVLIVLEAMKMEIEVAAPVAGTVKSISAVVGTAVNTDDLLVTLG
jgi:glutaconyl-CoA decarboxylase